MDVSGFVFSCSGGGRGESEVPAGGGGVPVFLLKFPGGGALTGEGAGAEGPEGVCRKFGVGG